MVLQCINGVSSKIWQLKNLILTLFGLIFRVCVCVCIYIYILCPRRGVTKNIAIFIKINMALYLWGPRRDITIKKIWLYSYLRPHIGIRVITKKKNTAVYLWGSRRDITKNTTMFLWGSRRDNTKIRLFIWSPRRDITKKYGYVFMQGPRRI